MNKRHVKHTKAIPSVQVRTALLELLETQLPLGIAGRQVDDATLWDILLYASVHGIPIEAACTELATASGNTVREHLNAALDATPTGLGELERQLNDALRRQLPARFRHQFPTRRFDIALDLVELPYHGQSQCDSTEVRRGKAKSGTTHFHV